MELKRIVARDLRAASERAVLEHGKDALFISSAELEGLTELIIAVETVQAPSTVPDTAMNAEVEATPAVAGTHERTHPATPAPAHVRLLPPRHCSRGNRPPLGPRAGFNPPSISAGPAV